MHSRDDRSEWEKLKAGKLDEGEGDAKKLLGGGGSRTKSLKKVALPSFAPRSAVRADAVTQRLQPITTYRLPSGTPVSCFHMRLASVSRRPRKGKHATNRQVVCSAASAIRRARDFQNYVERAGPYSPQFDEVEADGNGPILEGNVGKATLERLEFWNRVDEFERRKNARIQFRIDAELPYWLSAGERRTIARRFGEFFEAKGLFWFAAVHLPPDDGDHRNHHIHLIFHDRPRANKETADINFAPNKNRTFQGRDWVRTLRTEYARICTDVILKSAAEQKIDPPRIFFPGSYSDLGILRAPQKHLGPGRVAGIREGRVTVPLAESPRDDRRIKRQTERQLNNLISDLALIKKIVAERDLLENCERNELCQNETQRMRSELRRSLSIVPRVMQAFTKMDVTRFDIIRLAMQMTKNVAALSTAQADLIDAVIAEGNKRAAQDAKRQIAKTSDTSNVRSLPVAAQSKSITQLIEPPKSKDPVPQERANSTPPAEPIHSLAVNRESNRDVESIVVRLRALSWENLIELSKATSENFKKILAAGRRSDIPYLKELLAGQELIKDEMARRNTEHKSNQHPEKSTKRRPGLEI